MLQIAGGASLSLENGVAVARERRRIGLDDAVHERVERARQLIDALGQVLGAVGEAFDHVSAANSIELDAVTDNLRCFPEDAAVIAVELLAAAQALDLRRLLRTSPALERLHAEIRQVSTSADEHRPLCEDIERVAGAIRGGRQPLLLAPEADWAARSRARSQSSRR